VPARREEENNLSFFVKLLGPSAFFLLFALAVLLPGMSSAQQAAATGEPLVVLNRALPKGYLRQTYHVELQAQGGIRPLHWKLAGGSLPAGVDLKPDGVLEGAPTETGTFQFRVTVMDSGRPAHERNHDLTLLIVAPLMADWHKPPRVSGGRLDGSIKISNQTTDDFDLTAIVLAVNEIGRATAIGYQHFTLKAGTLEMEIPFGENLPRGAYDVHVDVVAEVASTNTIYRTRLVSPDRLQIQQGP
jgi:hypothetical protein